MMRCAAKWGCRVAAHVGLLHRDSDADGAAPPLSAAVFLGKTAFAVSLCPWCADVSPPCAAEEEVRVVRI